MTVSLRRAPWEHRLWKQQKGLCWLCMEPMIPFLRLHPLAASLDHLMPKSKGGANRIGNYLLAHRDCNSNRRNAVPIELSNGYNLRGVRDRAISKINATYGKRMRGLPSLTESG